MVHNCPGHCSREIGAIDQMIERQRQSEFESFTLIDTLDP